jgi:hypothetical protein
MEPVLKLTKLLLKIPIDQLVIALVMVSIFRFVEILKTNSFFFVLSAVDAVKDKVHEKTSEASKESNKNSAENEAKGIVETVKEKAAEA